MKVPIQLKGERRVMKTEGMVDSGASTIFLNRSFVERERIRTWKLATPIPLRNVDNTANTIGAVTHNARLRMKIGSHVEEFVGAVADIGDDDVIIGIDWLRYHNPEIDWSGEVMEFTRCPLDCASNGTGNVSEPLRKPSGASGVSDKHRRMSPAARKASLTPEKSLKVSAGSTLSQRIAEHSKIKEGEKTFEELVPEPYRDFRKVFSKSELERMPSHKSYDHAIDLEEGKMPPYSKIYPLPPAEQSAMKDYLEENLRKGYIRASKSPTAAPVFFVKKKDGSLRLCVDYRKLNAITVKNRYPLPLIAEMLDMLSQATVFTTIDLRWGYHNVRIKSGDEWKTAFRTREGLWESLVVNFGMCNAPATFQAMMNDIFKDLIGDSVFVYMDDIIVFSKDTKEHRRHVREVLRRLEENNLYVKPEKTQFDREEVDFLGFRVGRGKIRMDPDKVAAVAEWPVPRKVKDIQAFLGFANFYRRFIPDFSSVAAPLTRLLRKGVKWQWEESEQSGFDEMKRRFTASPVLGLADVSRPFTVECDASDYATGAVLSQVGSDGQLHPIAYYSKSFSDAERNYDIYDKELLAIIRALGEWRHFLEGAPDKITVVSDHRNLLYFANSRTLTRRQARWSLFLSRFDFEITHRPGRLGGKPDALSRRPDLVPEGPDNTERVVLDTAVFKVKAMRRGMTQIGADRSLLRRIWASEAYNESLSDAIQKIKEGAPRSLAKGLEEWNTEEGLVLFRGKVYVPKDEELRRDLVAIHHDSLAAGHPGRWKTYEMLSRNYWWPGMSVFVERYVSGCNTCARTKNRTQRPMGPLQPNPVPTAPWKSVTCDFIVELPPSNGFDTILVVVDRFTKQAHFIPTTTKVDAEETAELFLNHVWKLHGTPEQVISDRGPQFASHFLRALFSRLGIKSSLSTAFHPQTDGQSECVNQELEQYLRAFTDHRQTNWSKLLPIAEFAHNNRAHSATRTSPFRLLYGYDPEFAVLPGVEVTNVPVAEERLERLEEAQAEAKSALEVAAERMKRYYDRSVAEAESFEVGDLVWLDARNVTVSGARKLSHRRLGPFKVIRKIGELNYKLELPHQMKIHPVFHLSLLSRHNADTIPGRIQPPPEPVEIEGGAEYEVEDVLDSRIRYRKVQYLIKWKGYPASENTWEPVGNVSNAQDAIRDFHAKYPDAAGGPP